MAAAFPASTAAGRIPPLLWLGLLVHLAAWAAVRAWLRGRLGPEGIGSSTSGRGGSSTPARGQAAHLPGSAQDAASETAVAGAAVADADVPDAGGEQRAPLPLLLPPSPLPAPLPHRRPPPYVPLMRLHTQAVQVGGWVW